MSIYNKIRIIFVVSFLFLSAFFAATLYIEHNKHILEIEKKYVRTSLFLLKQFRQNRHQLDVNDTTLKLYLEESHLKRVEDRTATLNIFKHAKVLKKRRVLRAKMKILRDKHKRYLLLEHRRFHVLLEDNERFEPPYGLFMGYITSLLFLIGLYVWLTRSLLPLKHLQTKINKVAKGDLSTSFKSEKSDEIAEVSNAFDHALRQLESLIDSRQLFLRAIMHELKTPLGKGKILNSFVQDETLKDGYDEVFHRLELLLNEFSKIEQMLSANYEVKLANYNARDLVEQSLDLMLLDDEVVNNDVSVVESETVVFSTDFTLFPLALKNLIDNALKYSSDGKVLIVIDKDGLSVKSNGPQFAKEIEDYFKPFHGNAQGMGLGLYIVKNSLEMLKLQLNYKHEENVNSFTILHSV